MIQLKVTNHLARHEYIHKIYCGMVLGGKLAMHKLSTEAGSIHHVYDLKTCMGSKVKILVVFCNHHIT